jgi:signal transduction histidine kinase
MNLFREPFPNVLVGDAMSSHDVFAWATERIQKNIRRPDPRQMARELKLRLEERRKERGRIARELHDTLFQGFLGASLLLQSAVEQTPADSPTKASLNRVLLLMHRVIDEGRDTIQGLRSPSSESFSLEEALYGFWEELAPGNVHFRILVEGQPIALKPHIQEQFFLIGREAVLNALRHSGTTEIEVAVEYSPRRLRFVVRDAGCGINSQVVASGRDLHWGLQGMRERAASVGAQLRIWSRPGAGTEVEVSVPIQNIAASHASLTGVGLEA